MSGFSPDDLKQFAPRGVIHGGIVVAPVASAFFAERDAQGAVKGVTVDLLHGFAGMTGLPLELHIFSNSGQVTDAVADGACDVAFMPMDAERAKRVAFGPSYYMIESTYLVPAGSSVRSIDAVNRAGVRIVAIANTTTMRSARRTAPLASVSEVAGVDLMIEMAARGDGDAFALSADSFATLLPKLPGARVLAGSFQETGIGIAVPPGRAVALDVATALLNGAKSSGLVGQALKTAGFGDK